MTGLTRTPPRPASFLRRRPPRTRQGRSHNFFPTAPVSDVHVLSEVAKALLHLFQHRCRRVGVRARRTPRVPPLVEGGRNIMLHLQQIQPILPLSGTPLVQRAPIIQRFGGCGSDCRGSKPVPQGERPASGGSSVCTLTEQVAMAAMAATEPLGGTGRLSLEPV